MQLNLKVIPGAARNQVVGWLDDTLKVKVTSVAEKGKANKAVINLLADHLGIAKNHIVIISGHSAPLKTIEINDTHPNLLKKLPAKT